MLSRSSNTTTNDSNPEELRERAMKYLNRGIALTLMAGVLTTAASAGIKDHIEKRFKVADGNGDGVVTHEEMMAAVHKKFGKFDKNRDGYLELVELPKEMPVPDGMEQRMKKRLKAMTKKHPELSAEMKEHIEERFKRKHRRLNFVAKLDYDGDERVSVGEFAKRQIKRFKKADQNGDGNVTLAEAKDVSKQMMRHMHRKMKQQR